MSAMRLFVSFFAVLALSLPYAVDAAAPKCFMSSKSDLSGTKSFNLTSTADVNAYKTFVMGGLLCPSACYDAAAIFTFKGTSVVVQVKNTNKCDPSKEPTKETATAAGRGCSAGQKPPSIAVKLVGSARKLSPIQDRCDVDAITKAVDGTPSEGATVSSAFVLQAHLSEKIADINVDTEAGRTQLSEILQKLGRTEAEAAAQVSDPDKAGDVQKQLLSYVGTDKAAAQDAANALGLKLNGNLTDQERLNPDNFKSILNDFEHQSLRETFGQMTGFNAPDDGGTTDHEKARCAISKNESGSCGGNYSTIGPPTRNGGRAIGRYQVMDYNVPSWTAQACGRSMSPYEFRASPDCQDKVFDKIFGGYVTSCGSYAGAASKWFSGKCAIGGGGDGYISISGYVQKFMRTFGGNDFIPFGARNSMYTAGSSPFANVNPLGPTGQNNIVCDSDGYCYLTNSYAYNTTAPVGYPAGGVAQPLMPSGRVSTGGQGSTGGQISTQSSGLTDAQQLAQYAGGTSGSGRTVTTPPPPGRPLLSTPQTVFKDNPLTVSWSTVGMRADQQCIVLVQSGNTPARLAQGNEGSKTIAATPSGTLTFTLQCLAILGGQQVTKTASVIVN